MKQAGYLLIEMVIALAIVAIMSIVLSSMHASIIKWHQEAQQYATATNIATTALALLQNSQNKIPTVKGFTVTVNSIVIDPSIPFIRHTINVQFTTPSGKKRTVSITGGALYVSS